MQSITCFNVIGVLVALSSYGRFKTPALGFSVRKTATDTVQIQNENLLMTRPDGYKTDFYEKTIDMLISEMVPVRSNPMQNPNWALTHIESKAPTPIHAFWAQYHPTVAELQHRYLLKAQKT
jgi:hypothetical protein